MFSSALSRRVGGAGAGAGGAAAARPSPAAAAAAAAPPSCRRLSLWSASPPLMAPRPSPATPDNGLSARNASRLLCRAHPRRVARVSSQIAREIGDLLSHDPVVSAAVSPERAQLGGAGAGASGAVSVLVSVTDVQLSPDLQFARVLVSVYSDEKGRRRAMSALVRLQPYVRARVAERVRLRLAPELRFSYDDELERGESVLRALGRGQVARLLGEEAAGEAFGKRVSKKDRQERQEAAEKGQGEEEEGFFEGVGGGGEGAAEGEGAGEDEDEEEEEEDEEDAAVAEEDERRWRADDPAARTAEFLATPGPFDDMFGGGGGAGVGGGGWRSVSGPLPPRGGGRGGGGKGKGGNGGDRRRSN